MKMKNLPEYESFLKLLKIFVSAGDGKRFWEKLAPEVKEKLYQLVVAHRLQPIFYYRLHDLLPLPVLTEFGAIWKSNAAQAIRQQHELNCLKSFFKKNTIRYLPIKGADLLERIYPTPALRSMADLDILIHAEDCEHAVRVLKQAGWRQGEWEADHHLPAFYKNSVALELHHDLPGFHTEDYTILWEEFLPTDKEYEYRLSPELNWLMLFFHSCNHHWQNGGRLLLDLLFLDKNHCCSREEYDRLCRKFRLTGSDWLLAAFPELFADSSLWRKEFESSKVSGKLIQEFRILFLETPFRAGHIPEKVWMMGKCFSIEWWNERRKNLSVKALSFKYRQKGFKRNRYPFWLLFDISQKLKESFVFFLKHKDTELAEHLLLQEKFTRMIGYRKSESEKNIQFSSRKNK